MYYDNMGNMRVLIANPNALLLHSQKLDRKSYIQIRSIPTLGGKTTKAEEQHTELLQCRSKCRTVK